MGFLQIHEQRINRRQELLEQILQSKLKLKRRVGEAKNKRIDDQNRMNYQGRGSFRGRGGSQG